MVLWGVSILTTNPSVKYLLIVITLAILSTLVYFSYTNNWTESNSRYQEQTLYKEYANQERAKFVMQTGAGTFNIDGVTKELVAAQTATTLGTYVLSGPNDATIPVYTLSLDNTARRWFIPTHVRNTVDVDLNEDTVWDVEVDTGAADLNLDLSGYKVSGLVVNTGATDMDIKLGDRQDEVKVEIKTGASSLVLRVPETVGVRVDVESGVSSRDFADLKIVGDDLYESDGYTDAAKKIDIKLSAGASSLELVRY